MIIGILIYLVGYVLAYYLTKRYMTGGNLPWYKGDRTVTLIYSVLSWLSALMMCFLIYIENQDNKPEKW